MDALRAHGHTITYEWTTALAEGPRADIAIAEWEAVRDAELLVYLWESDQESARYEAGMAMGLQIPVVVSGNSDVFFFQLPHVHCVDSDDDIPAVIRQIETG